MHGIDALLITDDLEAQTLVQAQRWIDLENLERQQDPSGARRNLELTQDLRTHAVALELGLQLQLIEVPLSVTANDFHHADGPPLDLEDGAGLQIGRRSAPMFLHCEHRATPNDVFLDGPQAKVDEKCDVLSLGSSGVEGVHCNQPEA